MWLEEISKKIHFLKLAENRALANARLGNLYWKADQARARSFFDQAISELDAAHNDIEADNRSASPSYTISILHMTRRQILQLIVKNDEKLGFEAFIKSRPKLTDDAMANRPLPELKGRMFTDWEEVSPAKNLIRQEYELEQLLAKTVLPNNQKRAIEILERDDPEVITNNAYHLLKEIRRINQPVADDLARQIVARIFKLDLGRWTNAIRFINQLLTESLPENLSPDKFQIDEAELRRLAEKEADFLIKSGRNSPGSNYEYVLSIKPTLIKWLPERKAELDEIVIAPKSGGGGFSYGFSLGKDFQDQLKDKTIEQIIAQAETFPLQNRELFYMSAANALATNGDLDKAKKLLAENFTGQKLSDQYSNLYQLAVRQASERGDYETAARLANEINPKVQYMALTDLAIVIQRKTPEDKQKARDLLDRAMQTIPAEPVTREDFMKFDRVASAYALIDPEKGFRMLETLIDKYVEIGIASTIVDSYQSRGPQSARKGEFLMSIYNWPSMNIKISFKNFMIAGSERTKELIVQIKRPDLRINLELAALESGEDMLTIH